MLDLNFGLAFLLTLFAGLSAEIGMAIMAVSLCIPS
jgi:hypothetical protein